MIILSLCALWAGDARAQGETRNTETGNIDQRLFANAVDLYKQGKVEQALSDFERLYTQFASGAYANRALYELARHYYDTERIGEFRPGSLNSQKASGYLQKIVSEHPEGYRAPHALVRLGMLNLDPYVGSPNLNDAYANFMRVRRVYPNADCADEAAFGVGYTLYLQKEFARATGAMEKILLDYPRSGYLATARYSAARALASLGRHEDAFHHLARLRRDFPSDPYAERALDLSSVLAKFVFPYTYTFRESFRLGRDKEIFRKAATFRLASDGTFLAADSSLRKAARFTRRGELVQEYASEKPSDVWETMAGRVSVANERNVIVDGTAILVTEDTPKEELLYSRISAAVMTSKHEIVVFDAQRKALLRANRDGQVQAHLPKVKDVSMLYCDPQDRIWYISPSERALRCITLDGSVVHELITGTKDALVEQPVAFDMDFLGNVYILDARKKAVIILDPSLKRVLAQVTPAKGEGDMVRPTAVAAGKDGSVFVFDEGRGEVLRYE